MVKYIIFLLFWLGCGLDTSTSRAPLTGLWARHTIVAGTSTLFGADGVDIKDLNADGFPDVLSAWEQSGAITVSVNPGDTGGPWVTQTVTGMLGAEDAKFADFGAVVASDSGAKLYLWFGTTPVLVSSSTGHGHWMQVALADFDGDGCQDFAAIGRINGVAAWFRNPCPPLDHDGTKWTYNLLGPVGWGMTLEVADFGNGRPSLFLTDRAKIGTSWALYGARGLLNVDGVEWADLPFEKAGNPTAACPYCTPGDEMMSGFTTEGFVDCQSSAAKPNRVVVHQNAAYWGPPETWPFTVLPNPPFATGHCQHVVSQDIDFDGVQDYVISTWESNGLPPSAASGIYALMGNSDDTFYYLDISGPAGTKYDNVVLADVDLDGDLDIVESEQVENQGVFWLENPTYSVGP